MEHLINITVTASLRCDHCGRTLEVEHVSEHSAVRDLLKLAADRCWIALDGVVICSDYACRMEIG